jgi:hypothetical protein
MIASSSPPEIAPCRVSISGSRELRLLVLPLNLDPPLDHSWITDSRHKAGLGGHGRARRSGNLSSDGPPRSGRDTRGHIIKTVRDREAPGSNPGPPTNF